MNASPTPHDRTPAGNDPVVARRRQVARLAVLGQRIGYSLFGLAIVLFVIGLATTFRAALATTVIVCLVIGSMALAPAIVAGYAVRAADREDAERASHTAK